MRDELLRLRRVIGRVANRPVMIKHGFVNRQGAQPQGGGGGGGGDNDPDDSTVPYEAMLSNCPRSLFKLWQDTSLGCKDGKQLKGLLPMREEELNTSITGERWCGIQF